MNDPYQQLQSVVHQNANGTNVPLSQEQWNMLAEHMTELDVVSIFSEYGINSEQSFFKELEYRLVHYFFSETFASHDLRALLSRIDPDNELPTLLTQTTPEQLVAFCQKLIGDDPDLLRRFKSQMVTVLEILGVRIAHHGSNWRIWERLQEHRDYQQVFLDVQKKLKRYIDQPNKDQYEALRQVLIRAHDTRLILRHESMEQGISFALTMRISVIEDVLTRIEQLVAMLHHPPTSVVFQSNAFKVCESVLQAKSDKLKLTALFRDYFELVSVEITEFASSSGEKYVDGTKKGYLTMLQKGIIGGLLVGAFAVLKPWFGEMDLAPFMVFVKSTVIYSLIFLGIYFFKGTLATKQPAKTASHLAKSLDTIYKKEQPQQEFAKLVQSTFRNQLIALNGNVIIALPLAALTYLLLMRLGIDVLDDATAIYLLESNHPWTSGSLFYAALTGVCLAISGFMAGAANNWLVYHHIPDRLMQKHILRTDKKRLKYFSSFLNNHFTDIISNISLAFLLAFLPFVGYIFGLPLDIRHITFASANVGSGLAHFGFDMPLSDIGMYLLGVFLIGLINLAVSFSVTFLVAIKSRKTIIQSPKRVFARALPYLLKHPWRFFVPF